MRVCVSMKEIKTLKLTISSKINGNSEIDCFWSFFVLIYATVYGWLSQDLAFFTCS